MKNKTYFKKAVAAILAVTMLTGSVGTRYFLNSYAGENKIEKAETKTSINDYANLVDTFWATAVDNGQQFPGAVSPYGIVKLSPDTYPHTNDDHAGYDYNKSQISGFSHTRIEGVGGQGAGGDVLITPTYVNYTEKPSMESRAQAYSHNEEEATPGYYKVSLLSKTGTNNETTTDGSKIVAEMTTTTRTGLHRYTFPKAGTASVVMDLNYTYHGTDIRNAVMNVSTTAEGNTAISGRFSARNVSGHGKYTMYFYMETDTPTTAINTWNGKNFGTDTKLTGNDLGAVLSFNVEANQQIKVKVGISPISEKQAKIDMDAEASSWDFNQIKEAAHNEWNEMLGKIDITTSDISDPDGTLTKQFYTCLYRLFTTPVNATSTSGTYRGTDGKVYEANGYTHYDSWTLWDDYRKYPIIGLICPDIYKDLIQSIADMIVTGISTWGNETQPVLTVRNEHAVALLADGIAKGYTDIKNLEQAYEAAKQIANNSVTSTVESQGYFSGRVDKTVEYAYDDWALSIIADELGKTDESEYYLNRSFNYKNLYKEDAVTYSDGTKGGLLWPKDSSGNWMNADPEQYGNNGLYQGTLWQYTWYDSNDVSGLMTLFGGKEKMLSALNTLYGAKGSEADGKRMLHTNTNEIDLQTPYLFNYAGKPSETQYWVRQIYTKETWNRYSGTGEYGRPLYTKVYNLSPQGLMQTMDDDAGTMSAMYVAAGIGLFPMTPGDSTFQIGTPFFDIMTINLGNGRTFTINANNVSAENYYIQSATLNGTELNNTWLDYDQIAAGGTLTFEMGSEASTWGEDGKMAPSSSDDKKISAYDYEVKYSTNEIVCEGTGVNGKVTVTTDDNLAFDVDNISSSLVVTNLPEGVIAKIENATEHSADIVFDGKITKITSDYITNELLVEFADTAFANGVKALQVKNAVMSAMSGITLINKLLPTSISVKAPSKTDYILGEQINRDGGKIIASYGENNEYLKTVDMSVSDVKITNMPKQAGDNQNVTVTYMGCEATFAINVTEIKANEKGKILHYDFSEQTGKQVVDLTGNNYNGTLVNGAKMEHGNLILNSDDNQYVEIPTDVLSQLSKAGTISAWVQVDSVKNNQTLLTVGTSTDDFMILMTNNVIRAGLNIDGQGEKKTDSSVGIKHDEWAYVTYVIENNEVTLYKNGKKIKTSAVNGNLADLVMDSAMFRLGGAGIWNDPYFDGQISDFTIYNEALTTEEIAAEMKSNNNILEETIEKAETILSQGRYEISGLIELQKAVQNAKAVNEYENSTEEEIQDAVKNINSMIGALIEKSSNGVGKLEAEDRDDWSGGNLKTETSTDSSGASLVNLGATYDGAWLKYSNIKFGSLGATTFAVRYANNSGRCGANASLSIYLDSMEGEPYQVVSIPQTGSNWNAYNILKVNLNKEITGTHDIYIKMNATVDSAHPYVANIDYFEFAQSETDAYSTIQAENKSEWSGGKLKTETSSDSSGASLGNIGGTYTGAWLMYKDLSFGAIGAVQFSVRYVNNSTRCGSNAKLTIYLDSMENEPYQVVNIPVTGSNWNAYSIVNATLDNKITGTHDVYIVMTADTNNPYVANIDWFAFTEGVNITALKDLYDEYAGELEKQTSYTVASFEKFKMAMEYAQNVINNPNTTDEEVSNSINRLTIAVAGLIALADKTELVNTISKAEKIDVTYMTQESKEAFDNAINYANKINTKVEATDAEVALAITKLNNAIVNLEEMPEGDKTTLNGKLSQAKAIKATGYTTESFENLENAIDEGEHVAADKHADEASIREQINKLKAAIKALVKAEDSSVVLTDFATGIQIVSDESVIDKGCTLKINEVSKELIDIDMNITKAYKIEIMNGDKAVELKVGQNVKVVMPITVKNADIYSIKDSEIKQYFSNCENNSATFYMNENGVYFY